MSTCKKCYKQERVIMEDIVPLYIDTEVVIYSFLKGCTPDKSVTLDGDDPCYKQLCELLIKEGYIEKFYDSFVIPTSFILHLDTCVDNSWKDPDSIKVGYEVRLIQVFMNKYIKEHKSEVFNDYIENNTYYAISQGNTASKWFSNRIKEEVAYQDTVWDVFNKYGYNMSAPVVTLSHTMYGDRRMVYYHISDPEKYDNANTLKKKYITL